MRLPSKLLFIVTAIAFVALITIASRAVAQTRTECDYPDPDLSAECRRDPGLREILRYPEYRDVQDFEDLPPALRGWAPGEEAAVIDAIRANRRDPSLPPPRTPPTRGYSTWTFPPPANPNESLARIDFDTQQFLLQGVEQTLRAQTGGEVEIHRASAYVLRAREVVVCGRAAYRSNGRNDAGWFIIHPTEGAFPSVTDESVRQWCDRADIRLR